MKFLLVPGNNSFSHVAKCLVIEEELISKGHDVLIAVSKNHSRFMKKLHLRHVILPDIQESDRSGFPTVEWFRQPQRIIDCINAEIDLIKQYKPQYVLGVFRFTIKISSIITGVPYYSLICGCMIPESKEVIGFAEGEPGIKTQQIILDSFYRYAGSKICRAFPTLCTSHINDARHLLKGDRTFLWDFPEFLPLPPQNDIIHVGPLLWQHWPYDEFDITRLKTDKHPLAIIAFGTCAPHIVVINRITRILLELGFEIILAAGGQEDILNIMPNEPLVTTCNYAPFHMLFPLSSLIISHGGQMTVFEALQNEVPVLVMPSQPEQAHNGVCLERIGCGRRLLLPQHFQGEESVYINAFNRMSDGKIKSAITGLIHDPQIKKRLSDIKNILNQYKGAEQIVSMIEDA